MVTDCTYPQCSLLWGGLSCLPTKVRLVKAMGFLVVMDRCESSTVKKAECQRIDAFELWCWRRLLRVPWTARRSSQSILKEISLLNIHWKDWCWSWNFNPLATWCEELTHWKRPWCWERLKAGGERDDRGWDGWMASPTPRTWVWVSSGSWWWTGRRAAVHRVAKSRTRLSDWTDFAVAGTWFRFILPTDYVAWHILMLSLKWLLAVVWSFKEKIFPVCLLSLSFFFVLFFTKGWHSVALEPAPPACGGSYGIPHDGGARGRAGEASRSLPRGIVLPVWWPVRSTEPLVKQIRQWLEEVVGQGGAGAGGEVSILSCSYQKWSDFSRAKRVSGVTSLQALRSVECCLPRGSGGWARGW